MNQERKMSEQLKLNGRDGVDIGKEEDGLYEKKYDLSVHEHFNNTDEEIDIPNIGFFPKELLLEEQRLKEDHTKKDEESLVNDLDEKERKVRFQNLLTLLRNSIKLSNLFESRLKKCKLQIIKKELGKAKKMKENVPSLKDESTKITDNQSIVDVNEEEYYLSLFQQPKLFHGNLKAHQIEGLLWIRTLYENGLNGILADEMGLGKTVQTIAFYCFLLEMGITGPFLVIAPLSTIPNWLSEFSKFSPKLPTVLYHGTESERIGLRPKFKNTQKVNNLNCQPVVITTYDVVRRDITYLKNIDWKFITIDEGQKVKNANSHISKCMRAFNCTNKLILTGTPIQNDMSELWSLLNWLMPKIFDQLEDFNSWFVIDKFFDSNDKIVNMVKKDELLDIILKILKPFILRREKNETDLNLPPKKEIVIYAPLTETQKQLYEATLNKQMEILLNKKKDTEDLILEVNSKRRCVESIIKYTDLNAIRVNVPEIDPQVKNMAISVHMQNPFIQLKKIVNHPYLVQMPLIPGENKLLVDENITKVSGKFQLLDAMLTKLKILGHKVLLFSTMTQLMDVIEEFLMFRKFSFTRLDGTMSIQLRVDAMTTFNSDPECFLMMISTRAGGLGLNLTSADTVILFDSDWNPQVDLQAQDRCHRMGQTKPVVVYRFCSKNTIDERILNFATAKRKLEKMIIGSGSFSRTATLTMSSIEDLMTLLKSSEYTKKIQPNGFILSDEELDAILDRSDMYNSASMTLASHTAEHFKVLTNS
ncbi:lymphoid-specific helicase-like isoform X3 [Metopolophium dirhodum]|uniref:lymphoid-specific helicase-like isoform X3 n=1 Tax=Metopolophium dirhodum TaxID=44670 RepID=UPI00298FCA8E|nr:lymphoid-specific helicase-like isoform X3 [Metopolophium dirhodum]